LTDKAISVSQLCILVALSLPSALRDDPGG
jgi:hypothetical protein